MPTVGDNLDSLFEDFDDDDDQDRYDRAVQEGYVMGRLTGRKEGAAVAFGLMGMAEATRARPQYTPCDRPYADCKVCGGTGKHDIYPCSSCVWRRYAEENFNLSADERGGGT